MPKLRCVLPRIFFFVLFATLMFPALCAYAAQVTLRWNSNTEPDIAGYKIYYGASTREYFACIDVGQEKSCAISAPSEGQVYYFAVTAYDIFGNESDYSAEVAHLIVPVDSDGDGFPDGGEVYYGFDPSDAQSRPGGLLMGIGNVAVGSNWKRVAFDRAYFNPVVVAKPISSNDTAPAVIRIRNVDSTGFEIRVQEWDYLDGFHLEETVSYVVMEAGGYTLSDGSLVEVGKFVTDDTDSFGAVFFDRAFDEAPVVVAAVSTFNESDAVTGRMRNVSATGFEFCMQEQELNIKEHATEEISFIAWQPSSGLADNLIFEVRTSQNEIDDLSHAVSFSESFAGLPVLLADMQTTDGLDTANVRCVNKDQYAADLSIAEEQSADSETDHTTEVIGIMLFSLIDVNADADGDSLSDMDEYTVYTTDLHRADTDGDGMHDGQEVDYWQGNWDADFDSDGTINLLDSDSDGDGFPDGGEVYYGFDPSDPESRPEGLLMEIGDTAVGNNWKRVAFDRVYFNPVVVAKPISSNDAAPAVIRIRNLGGTGFEIRVQEWDYLDDKHANESVSYLVMEAGGYTLSDGKWVEAGKFLTDNTHSFEAVSFGQTFNEAPVVLASVTTFNESEAVTGRMRNISATGFEFYMQEQEANPLTHVTEEICFIAWEPSSGVEKGLTFEVEKTENAVTHLEHTIAFTQPFEVFPVFLADIQTNDGQDTANLRWTDKDLYAVDIRIDEEQSRDSEREHTTEVVGYMAFSQR